MILRDPVHDLVTFEAEEEQIVAALLATREVQRLRRIKQLGVTHLVFPGAEHSRFTHAVGAAHVMTRLVRRLRGIDGALPFWQRLASDRARDALAAALLHDVGHGPYSHLFEAAVPGARHHEEWSLAIVRDPSTDVHKVLSSHAASLPDQVSTLIHAEPHKPYPLPYLAHAVSGTFDVDRCDYLLRDAHMTGVRYGLFDLDWLLRSLCFGTDGSASSEAAPRLAIDGMKGIAAIEGFLLGRRFMFEQVYLHKATRAAESLVKAIFARAAELVVDGTKLDPVPEALVCSARGEPVSLGAYLALDDTTVGAAFAAWESSSDPTLADLCARLRGRRLGKTVEIPASIGSPSVNAALLDEARAATAALGLDPKFHVGFDVAEDGHGNAEGALEPPPDDDPLTVVLNDGRALPLREVSSLIAALGRAPVRRVRLIVPEPVRAVLEARIASMRTATA